MSLKIKPILLGGTILGIVAIFSCHPRPEHTQLNNSNGLQEERFREDTWPESFGLGRTANQLEIDSLTLAIPPSGKGLPQGEGLALRGKSIYLQKCAACHGLDGKGGAEEALVATDSLFSENPRVQRAIGNYWPYATTVFDYIRRAMPSNSPGSLTNEEVYDLTAWLLLQNEIIEKNFILNAQTLPEVVMPAKIHYVEDTRTTGPNPVY